MTTARPSPPHPLRAGAPADFARDPAAIAIVEAMRRRNPKADPLARLPGVHPGAIPRHIAVIMDGNGRWARERGFERIFGHRNGAAAVRRVVEECGRLGVEVLTLYSFSLENWKRPPQEVEALMALCLEYLRGERDRLVEEGIRFRAIGRREGLPAPVVEAIDEVVAATSGGTAGTLCIAINYSARAEIVDAARALAARAAAGQIDPGSIEEGDFERHLYTAGLPDPDLLVRTAGEMRLSNYLLWQISYAELYVTPVYWPDFGVGELHEAVRSYALRSRRFGGLDPRPE